MNRLTCAFVICPTPHHADRVRLTRTYLFRADGRTGSVRRGSAALSADLLALYVAEANGAGRRQPMDLEFSRLCAQGVCDRTPLADAPRSSETRVPARRTTWKHLHGSHPSSPFFCCAEHRSASLTGPIPHERDCLARTEGGFYFATVHMPLYTEGIKPVPPPSWEEWALNTLRTWDRDVRDDEYGEPIVRCLPRDVSNEIRDAFGQVYVSNPLRLVSEAVAGSPHR